MDGLFAHTRRGGSDRAGLEDQLRAGDSHEQQQIALYTGSDRIFYRLSNMLRRETEPPVRARIVAFARRFQEQAGLESFTFEVFANHPSHNWTIEELEKLADFQKEHPSWWSQMVEAPFEALSESKRNAIKNEDLKNAFDVSVGVGKGVYSFGKGTVEGLYELAEFGIKFASDERTRAHSFNLVKEWLWFCVLLQYGTPAMKQECLKKIQAIAQLLIEATKDYFVREWEKAKKENKTDELLTKWTTRGLLEFATLIIGLLKGAKAGKVISETEKAAAELSQAAAKLSKTVGGEKAMVEVLTDAPGAATKVESKVAKASAKWWELEEPKTLVQRMREANKYRVALTPDKIKALYRKLPGRARKKLQALSPKIREHIERSLYYFSESVTHRDGRVRPGSAYFVEHPETLPKYIDQASAILKDIQAGKEIEMYSTMPKKREALSRIYDQSFKGAGYHDYVRGDYGSGNRFGTGKYLATNEQTSLKEVFLARLQPDGTVKKAADVANEFSVLKVSFKPTFKNNNFLVYPSFANPGGGICIVDLEHADWLATESAGLVRHLKEVP